MKQHIVHGHDKDGFFAYYAGDESKKSRSTFSEGQQVAIERLTVQTSSKKAQKGGGGQKSSG